MENTNQREYLRGNDNRWYYRETETINGNQYTNYYQQAQANTERDNGFYQGTDEQTFNQRTA